MEIQERLYKHKRNSCNMKIRYLLGLILILFAWTYVCRWYHCRYDTPSVSDTVYVERIVEVRDSAPVAKEDKTIGQISVPVHSNSLYIGKNHVKETEKSLHDTANIAKKTKILT